MFVSLIAFTAAFMLAVITTPLVRVLALRLGVIDKPDQFRKVHGREVPQLGGIAIYVAFVVSLTGLYFYPSSSVQDLFGKYSWEIVVLVIGATVAMVLGAADDVWGLRARWKLLFQTVAAGVAIAGGYAITAVSVPFVGTLFLGPFCVLITLFWFLGCMNAINLMDGLDGLAAGICLFVSLTMFVVSLLLDNSYAAMLACLSGAIFGFLLFNFHPAKIFLGDTGSIMLGFLIAGISIMASRKAQAAVALLVPVIALGIPILDTSLAILRRWSRKLPIASPDRGHIHHVLLSLGLSHRRTVIILYGACVALCGAAVLVNVEQSGLTTLLVLGVLCIVVFVSVRLFGGVRFTDLVARMRDDLERRQRATEAKISVEKAVILMRNAHKPSELWECFSTAVEGLGLDRATLRLSGGGQAKPEVMVWEKKGNNGRPEGFDVWSARLSVHNGGAVWGELQMDQAVHEQAPLLPEAAELADRLRRELAVQLVRLAKSKNKE